MLWFGLVTCEIKWEKNVVLCIRRPLRVWVCLTNYFCFSVCSSFSFCSFNVSLCNEVLPLLIFVVFQNEIVIVFDTIWYVYVMNVFWSCFQRPDWAKSLIKSGKSWNLASHRALASFLLPSHKQPHITTHDAITFIYNCISSCLIYLFLFILEIITRVIIIDTSVSHYAHMCVIDALILKRTHRFWIRGSHGTHTFELSQIHDFNGQWCPLNKLKGCVLIWTVVW